MTTIKKRIHKYIIFLPLIFIFSYPLFASEINNNRGPLKRKFADLSINNNDAQNNTTPDNVLTNQLAILSIEPSRIKKRKTIQKCTITVSDNTISNNLNLIYTAAISPDKSTIAYLQKEYTIIIKNINTDTVVHTIDGHINPITTLCYTPNGRFIVSGTMENILIWHLITARIYRTISLPENFIEGRDEYSLSFSHDHRDLILTTAKQIITIEDPFS